MFLLFNAIVASMDGFVMGMGLRLARVKITKGNMIVFLLGNVIIYTFFLFLYRYLQLRIITKFGTTILYLVLSWYAFKNKEESYPKSLEFKELMLLLLTHSIDGTAISLGFVYSYRLEAIVVSFSLLSVAVLILGYYSVNVFQGFKKTNYISSLLFVLLAIWNQFF